MSTCETCRFWKVPQDGWGLCEYDMEPGIKMAIIYPLGSDAEFHTRPDFGCNQHQPHLHETFSPCAPTAE